MLITPTSENWAPSSFIVDLYRPNPALCFIENEQGDIFFSVFDSYGRIYLTHFDPSHFAHLIAYDEGFSGYGARLSVPIPSFPTGREDKIKAKANQLSVQLLQLLGSQTSLSPPLKIFEHSCRKAKLNFPETFIQFLIEWDMQPGFIPKSLSPSFYPLLENLNWKEISTSDLQAIQWTCQLFSKLESDWKQGADILDILEAHHWPFMKEIRQTNASTPYSLLNVIAQKISSMSSYLPALDFPPSPSICENIRFLSAYLRIYGIDYRTFFPYQGHEQECLSNIKDYYTKEQKIHTTLQQEIFLKLLSLIKCV